MQSHLMHVVFMDNSKGESLKVPGDEKEELPVVDILRMDCFQKENNE